jgi:hypothetical protein
VKVILGIITSAIRTSAKVVSLLSAHLGLFRHLILLASPSLYWPKWGHLSQSFPLLLEIPVFYPASIKTYIPKCTAYFG